MDCSHVVGKVVTVLVVIWVAFVPLIHWGVIELWESRSIEARAKREYKKRRDTRAAEYMALGLSPSASYERASKDMTKEAEEAIKAGES